MAIDSFANLARSIEAGKIHYQYVTKATTPIPGTAGFFVDMNQTSGQPKYNAFAGTQLAFNPLSGSGNGGVYVGPTIPGTTKHLVRWQSVNVNTAANTIPPDHVLLCDYLGFYPLIDCDDVDPQDMDNTLVPLRYADGKGVQIVLVVQAPMGASAAVTITYTNSDGVSGRTSTHTVLVGTALGVCAGAVGTSGIKPTPFWPLAGNDDGVRSIESIQFAASAGGFVCAALVKPIASKIVLEAGVPVEKIFGFERQNIPEIKDGAYLNFLIQRAGTLAGSFRSELVFINS